MGRRGEVRRRASEAQRWERQWKVRGGAFIVAVVVALFTKGLWADWFDALIGLLGDGSTAAAFVGWLAGFAWLVYALLIVAVRRWWPRALDRTWPLGVLLFIPFLTLQPSRTHRSEAVRNEYWYLGSFLDTYFLAVMTVLATGAAGGLILWLSTRGDQEDVERSARLTTLAGRVGLAVLSVGTVGTLVWALVGF